MRGRGRGGGKSGRRVGGGRGRRRRLSPTVEAKGIS